MPGSIHQHFFTQCTLSLNDWEASRAGLCQCGSFVMFVPNAKILTDVSENPTVLKIQFVGTLERFSRFSFNTTVGEVGKKCGTRET